MKPSRQRRRWTWRYDLVFDLEFEPKPEASTSGELVLLPKATGAHVERHRRRWGRVR